MIAERVWYDHVACYYRNKIAPSGTSTHQLLRLLVPSKLNIQQEKGTYMEEREVLPTWGTDLEQWCGGNRLAESDNI
jgi:hypothetical protein